LSERTLLVDYDTRMGKTGRKIGGNWNSPRQVCFWGKPGVPDPLSNVC
jgi:hypothetical protein